MTMQPFTADSSEQAETHWNGISAPAGPIRRVSAGGRPPSYRNSIGWSGQDARKDSDRRNVARVAAGEMPLAMARTIQNVLEIRIPILQSQATIYTAP